MTSASKSQDVHTPLQQLHAMMVILALWAIRVLKGRVIAVRMPADVVTTRIVRHSMMGMSAMAVLSATQRLRPTRVPLIPARLWSAREMLRNVKLWSAILRPVIAKQ